MTETQTPATDPMTEFFGEPIYIYTPAQAVEDGVLLHLNPATALEAGYTIPVLLTPGAYAEAIEWTRDDPWQSEDARFWDVLSVGRAAAKAALASPGERTMFRVYRVPNRTKSGAMSRAEIASRSAFLVCTVEGYDGQGGACITISLWEEQ
jgi:hypothetical protein